MIFFLKNFCNYFNRKNRTKVFFLLEIGFCSFHFFSLDLEIKIDSYYFNKKNKKKE